MNSKKFSHLQTLLNYSIFPLLLGLFAALTYYPSLTYDFQFDDIANIKKFFDLRLKTFWDIAFTSSRWISYCLNSFNYKIGKYNPFWYRTENVFFHIITGILIYYIVQKLLSKTTTTSFFFKHSTMIAYITTFLFLLHPVQTQTVSYVIQGQLEGLSALCMMFIILLFIAYMESTHTITRILYIGAIIICTILAAGTKEIIVICPVMLALIDWFFFAQGSYKKILSRAPLYCVLFGIIFFELLYVFKTNFVKVALTKTMELNNNVGNVITTIAGQKITRWNYFISQFKVILHYIFIFIWPWNISVDYDWKMVPNFFHEECLIPLGILTIIGITLFYFLRKNKTNIWIFGILWFFIGLSPRSTFIPSTELVADYKTYFSSFGLFFFIALCITYCLNSICTTYKLSKKSYFLLFSIIHIFVLAGFCFATYTRNKIWRSQEEFWLNIIENSPKKARAYNNYAVSLAEKKRFDEAIPYLRKAIKLDVHYPDPWSNIAVCFGAIKKTDMAIAQLNKAVQLNPHYPEFYNNLASLHLEKKNFKLVEEFARHAISLRRHYGKAYFNLAQALYGMNRKEEAFDAAKIACLKADFETPEAFTAYAQLSLELKKFDDAITGFEHLYAMMPNNADVKFNLANAYFCAKQHEKAKTLYIELTNHDPQEYRSWFNLAETYIELGNKNEAIRCFAQAQPLAQQSPQIASRIAQFTHQKLIANIS